MRIKGRKYISLVLTLMFLISFFPGYSLAGETDGQDLLPINEFIESDFNYSDVLEEVQTEPAEGELGGQPVESPADEVVGTLEEPPDENQERTSEKDIRQAAQENPAAFALTVKHVLQSFDGQTFAQEEKVADVQIGNVVAGIDYMIRGLPEGIIFTGSQPESLIIQAEGSQITLNYQELPWPADELLEEEPVFFEQLNEDEMEPYFSDIELDFSSLNLAAKSKRSMMKSVLSTPVLAPGEVKATKTAEWSDYENRIAKITLNVQGEPVLNGADIVLVVDNSGSMANDSGKVRDCTGEIISPELIETDSWSSGMFGSTQWESQTYLGVCTECGKTIEYTITRSRVWNFGWGDWSDWSTPNTTHSIYRIDIAKQAAASFVSTVLGAGNPAGNRVALVTFSSSGYDNHLNGIGFQNSVSGLTASINGMFAQGGTNYTEALAEAKSYLDERLDQTRPAYVVFVSDGAPGLSGNSPNDPDWNGINQATALKNAGVTIYSVGIALSQANAAALTALATVENGSPLYKNVKNVDDLTAVLTKIGGAILNAGTAALMIDEINTEHFDLLSGTSGYDLPDGVIIDTSGDIVKVKWNIGAITKELREIILYVKLKDEFANTGNSYHTNADINLSYTDTDDQPQTKDREEIGHPNVVVNHTVTFVAGANGSLDGTASYSNIPDGTLWDTAVNVPGTVPDPGYKFSDWTPEFPETVTSSATYIANFAPNNDTGYKAEHYQQDLGAATYTLVATDEMTGTTGAQTAAVAKDYAGFTAQTFSQAVIAGNGSTVVKIYYDRNAYTVTWLDEDGTELEKDLNVLYGTTPSYDGTTPSKAATAEFTYTFAGWTPAISPVTGDATYTATYSAATNAYTVTWLDEDGTELEKDLNVLYGTIPSYDGTTPSKAATAEFTYTFAGWTPAISPVTGDATYTATYSAATNAYTVTWLDEDGTELEKDLNVLYGTIPSYDGTTPSKAATAEFTYTFAGWTPAISPVTGDATYTATYKAETNGYTVIWEDEDGSVLETDEDVLYGTMPSFDGETPSKEATAEFTYSFDGWTPEVSPVSGDVTYTATYKAETNGYTVNWEDEDGSVLETDEDVLYGTMPSFDGETPSKEATAEFTYSFDGWTPEVSPVTGDVTYTAAYKAETNGYTVIWEDEDGSVLETDEDVLYGTMPSFDGETPSKEATAEFTYSFDGWTPEVSPVSGDVTYTATYKAETNGYTVNWEDEDGSVLETDEDVLYGTMPSFDGETPSKEATAEFTYSFDGWTPEVSPVTGDVTYTAAYKAETNGYTVIWEDEDGSVLETDEDVLYGTMPSFDGETPSKEATAEFTYSFDGWTPEVSPVSGDVTYTATYKAETNGYTVNWEDEDGSVLETDEDVLYGTMPSFDGETPSKEATAEFTYSFDGWTPEVSPVTGDVTYTAAYKAETNGYTVIWEDEDGSILETDEDVLYGTMPSFDGETPSKAATAEFTYSFDGWTPEVSPVSGDVTYTATYSERANRYTLTYAITGSYFTDPEYAAETYEYGAAVTAAAVPAKSGYTFHGWTGVPATMPAEDVTATGYYTKNSPGGGPSGGGDPPATEEPIEVPEEPEVAIPLNKDDHFAYVVGYPDNTVQPVGKITREEVAAVFYRLLDAEYRETVKTTINDFPDMAADKWSAKHVSTLASIGIIVGYPDGSFRPENTITRAELATIASKFDKLSPFEDNRFSDIGGHWANQYINSAAQKGWVAGYPDGTFKPDQAITRAEFMTLVNKVLERRVLKEDILPDAKDFPDLSPNAWYYTEVQEAINSHHYERATRQDYEIWTDIYYPELDM